MKIRESSYRDVDVRPIECDQVMTSPLQLSRAQTTSHVTVEDPQERTVDSRPQGTLRNIKSTQLTCTGHN